jgi:outer membrane protein OmpA-like peptidoglycan-associated protein
MSAETHRAAAALTANRFARTGYRFVGWNTSFKGTGVSYANGAKYSFATSTTLYAKWRKIKVSPSPPPPTTIPGGVTISPFSAGSSSLTPELKTEIHNLAIEIKLDADSQITLFGFGDKTVPTGETNVELGRQRAAAVATYLEAQLAAFGLKGWTISISPASPNQLEFSSVIATLS